MPAVLALHPGIFKQKRQIYMDGWMLQVISKPKVNLCVSDLPMQVHLRFHSTAGIFYQLSFKPKWIYSLEDLLFFL